MIDIHKIVSSSLDENLDNFLEEVKDNPSKNELESEVRVVKTLMKYSEILLKNYHEALKIELSKQGIKI